MMKRAIYYFIFIFIMAGMVTLVSSCNKDKDTTPPVITILGDNPATACRGAVYIDAGATASDDVDGDVSSTIAVVENNVNTDAVGQYSVKYRANDKSGNFIEAQRTVNVIECK